MNINLYDLYSSQFLTTVKKHLKKLKLATIYFQDGSILVPANDSNIFVSSDGQHFRTITANRHHTGQYSCEAQNLLGSVSKMFNVEVVGIIHAFSSIGSEIKSLFLVDVHWSPWESWSPCSASCGQGIRLRTRNCLQSDGRFAGQNDCDGVKSEAQICQIAPCPVNLICNPNFV